MIERDATLELLRRIEKQQHEILKLVRRLADEAADGPPPEKARREINGVWHTWGGQGTGWVPDWPEPRKKRTKW